MTPESWNRLKEAIEIEIEIAESELEREQRPKLVSTEPSFLRGQIKSLKRVQDIMNNIDVLK